MDKTGILVLLDVPSPSDWKACPIEKCTVCDKHKVW